MQQGIVGGLLLVSVLGPSVLSGQTQDSPPLHEYRAWAAGNAVPLEVSEPGASFSGFAPLASVVGTAQLVSFSEPFHGAHEPLALRNRLFEYLVREHGFTAIALETGLAPSKALYDYVAHGLGDPLTVAREAFSYRLGQFQENLDLLLWMRAYNDSVSPGRALRLYGVDLTGQEFPFAYRSLELSIDFLRRTALSDAAPVIRALEDAIPLFRSDVYPSLSEVQRDRLTVTIDQLIAYLDLRRGTLIDIVGVDEYAWARRQAVVSHQDDAFLWNLAHAPGNLREVAMADNVKWAVDQERHRGRVLFFANNTHTGSHHFSPGSDVPPDWPARGVTSAGSLLRRQFGDALVTIGTYLGRSSEAFWYWNGTRPFPPDPDGLEGLLGGLDHSAYLVDLRTLPVEGRLRAWMLQEHETSMFNRFHLRFAPADAFDAIVYIDRFTPAGRAGEGNP